MIPVKDGIVYLLIELSIFLKFNLSIRDLPEILTETKKVYPEGSMEQGDCLCVEFSLQTADDETLVLETWSISMSKQTDPTARVSYVVYNRMGIMLKSLLCASRVTPAYSLSRKQGPETYVVCYRLYSGEPQVGHLGDGYVTKQVGSVPTPTGTLQVSVCYRVKLELSPHSSMRGIGMQVKDDHFTIEEKRKQTENNVHRTNYTAVPCHAYQNHRYNLYYCFIICLATRMLINHSCNV